nr:alpha/beta hydrolase [Streptomyces sp. RTd22]
MDVYARAFQAPGAMRALCEIYRELDHDAQIHRDAIASDGKLTVPVLASGGAAQALAANYRAMCEEIADNVTGHLVEGAGHWVPEENPEGFLRMFLDFDSHAPPEHPTQEEIRDAGSTAAAHTTDSPTWTTSRP